MNNKILPLKFHTIYKDKIWGGDKIRTVLGKDYGDLPNCGETWEVSGVEGNVSIVAGGEYDGTDLKSLIGNLKQDLVGKKVYDSFGDEFPLLIKFIDANDDLSIQVHPDDKLGKKRHDSSGKTEMWYVLQADEGASLISGFNQELNQDKFLQYFNSGKLTEVLNRELVKDDDVFFLPAGRVHTIGKGLLIAEIQQTSDMTYRIYDFDRTDANGKKRELHLEESLEAIDYKKYDSYKTRYAEELNSRVLLESCQYFETNKLNLDKDFPVDHSNLDSFKIYICLGGEVTIEVEGHKTTLNKGEVVLVPATTKQYLLKVDSSVSLLETYVPNWGNLSF